jgi:hypothetical protein
MKIDIEKAYENQIENINQVHKGEIENINQVHKGEIEIMEKTLKDKQNDLNIALREHDILINVKEKEIIKLENHIKEMTQGLINKPTYALNITQTVEDYMKTKTGIHLNVLQCLKPKESKKIDLLILNGKYDNFKNYDYYNLLCSLIGQKVLLENIVVIDKHRGSVVIKYNNKTEHMTRFKTPFETSYELGKINEYIIDKLEPKYKQYIKSNDFYINKLRLKLSKSDNRVWGDVKNSMVMVSN